MGKLTRVKLERPTFINDTLYPAGFVIDVDLSKLGITSVDDTHKAEAEAKPEPVALAPNLTAVDAKSSSGIVPVEVKSVSPTGPAPTKPQAIPPGTMQIGESFVAAAEDDADADGHALVAEGSIEDGGALAPEGPDEPAKKTRRAPAKRAPAKAKADDKPASEAPTGGAGSALSE